MKDFSGKLAVITGGGTGMGRELARALVRQGCAVAMCDVSQANMDETAGLCAQDNPQGVVVSAHICDVADAAAVAELPQAVALAHGLDAQNPAINLLVQ